jgi:hypothetical protein
MDEPHRPGMSTAGLLAASWRVWRARAGMFMLLMAIPAATIPLVGLILNYLIIGPHLDDTPLQEIWRGMGVLQRVSFFVLFLGTFAAEYRALAASAFATQEIQSGRSVGIAQAFRSVRRKQLRLFWIVMLASMLTGPFGLMAFPLLAFATAPGFPVAILENMPAFAAIKRGNALAKGGRGRIALLIAIWLGLGIASVVGLVWFLAVLQERFGRAWFLRPVPALGFWLLFLIPQWYMIALTLNFLDQRKREGEISSAADVPVPG